MISMRDERSPEKTLIPEGYLPRLIDKRLEFLLDAFGAIEITGSKWCGKTWTALAHARSAAHLDDGVVLARAEEAPKTALVGKEPHLIDEWQEMPAVWDEVRRAVDENANIPGQFILTGSTRLKIENDRKNPRKEVHHSGAGRIKRVSMWPMTLVEEGLSNGAVSLSALFDGNFAEAECDTKMNDIAHWCCRGGWPANVGKPYELAVETAVSHLESLYDVSIPRMGLNPNTASEMVTALALNLAQAVTTSTLIKDMSRGDEEKPVARSTIERYLDALRRLFIIYDVSGWSAPLRSKARARIKPKRYFVDSSLAAVALHATPSRLMEDMQTLGTLFETLIMRDLNSFVSTYSGIGNEVRYYRDQFGLEVDAIIEKAGRWAGIEIKLSETKVDRAADSLLRLKNKAMENPMARIGEPAFLAVIVGIGSVAYRRKDGVYVIPAATLTA